MAKAIITIEDTADNRYALSVEFDPPLPEDEEDATPAQLQAVDIYGHTIDQATLEGRKVETVTGYAS